MSIDKGFNMKYLSIMLLSLMGCSETISIDNSLNETELLANGKQNFTEKKYVIAIPIFKQLITSENSNIKAEAFLGLGFSQMRNDNASAWYMYVCVCVCV